MAGNALIGENLGTHRFRRAVSAEGALMADAYTTGFLPLKAESRTLDFRSYVSKEKSGATSPTFRPPSLADNHILLNGKIEKTTLDVLDMIR